MEQNLSIFQKIPLVCSQSQVHAAVYWYY